MRCVVTGAAGFLGSHLVDALLARGDEVVGIDSFVTGSPANLDHLKGNDKFHFVRTDVTRYIAVSGPVDRVLHFASPASPKDFTRIPIHILKVGALGTLNALGLTFAKKARFLLASTSEVYGDPEVHPQKETYWGHVNPIGERAVYDEAKRFAEALTMAYRKSHGTETRIVRIFNTYGPRMRLDDGRVLPEFAKCALTGKPLKIHGDGKQTRSFCYVDDLIRGILLLLESDIPDPVNVGNPEEMTILQFAEEVLQLTKSSSRIEFHPLPQDDPRQRRPDITKARTLLGWEPTVSRTEGLARTIEYFKHALGASAP